MRPQPRSPVHFAVLLLRCKDLSFGSGCAESRVPLQCFRNFGFRFRVFEGSGLVQDLRISARQSSRCAPAPVYGLDFRCGVRRGLVFKVHGLVYHSTLGLGVIKKKRRCAPDPQTPNRSHLHSKTSGSEACSYLWLIPLASLSLRIRDSLESVMRKKKVTRELFKQNTSPHGFQ